MRLFWVWVVSGNDHLLLLWLWLLLLLLLLLLLFAFVLMRCKWCAAEAYRTKQVNTTRGAQKGRVTEIRKKKKKTCRRRIHSSILIHIRIGIWTVVIGTLRISSSILKLIRRRAWDVRTVGAMGRWQWRRRWWPWQRTGELQTLTAGRCTRNAQHVHTRSWRYRCRMQWHMTRIGVLLRVVLVMGDVLLVVVVDGILHLHTRRERERMVMMMLLLPMLVHMRRRNRTAGSSKPRRPSHQMACLVWVQYRMCMRVPLGISGGVIRRRRRRRIIRLRYDFRHVRMVIYQMDSFPFKGNRNRKSY